MSLTASNIKSKVVGRHSDGNGLILTVHKTGRRQWFLRVQVDGKRSEFLLGNYPDLSLSEARAKAKEWREAFKAGEDPRIKKTTPTFKAMAEQYLELMRPTWKNAKHPGQWANTLARYAYPILGEKMVHEITAADCLSVLTPIWNEKRETAKRVKQRMGAVLDYAVVQGFREGNPIPSLKVALPSGGQVVRHMPAMPHGEVAAFIRALRASERVTYYPKLALEFTILTACRSGEVRGMRWDEIQGDVWVIPPSRMKAGKEHRVPLPGRCLDIISQCHRESDFVFPGRKGALSDMSLQMPLRRVDGRGFTVHGFRSSFRDWAEECTEFDRNAIEICLAHSVGSAIERAYRRTDLLAVRQGIMVAWASYLGV